MKLPVLAASLMLAFGAASAAPDLTPVKGKPFTWDNATVYFLVIDRFNTEPVRFVVRPKVPFGSTRKADTPVRLTTNQVGRGVLAEPLDIAIA